MAEIINYVDYFHDGSVIDIKHDGNNIVYSLSSAEMDIEDLKKDREGFLSEDDCIQGKLHIEGINSITVDDNPFNGKLNMKYPEGDLKDFEISQQKVEFGIMWYDPHSNTVEGKDFTYTIIEAEKIWWETVRNLEDQYP